MKHKDEWKELVEIGERKGLIEEQIILLIALREIEAGMPGYEYNLVIAQGTSLKVQAEFVADLIIADAKNHRDYLLSYGFGEPMGFVEYFVVQGGPLAQGWTDEYGWVEKLDVKMYQVREEIDRNGSNSID